MFEMYSTKRVSLGTRISCPRSLITTSAARSSRLLLIPVATAASVPVEQGQMTICLGAALPDAGEKTTHPYQAQPIPPQ